MHYNSPSAFFRPQGAVFCRVFCTGKFPLLPVGDCSFAGAMVKKAPARSLPARGRRVNRKQFTGAAREVKVIIKGRVTRGESRFAGGSALFAVFEIVGKQKIRPFARDLGHVFELFVDGARLFRGVFDGVLRFLQLSRHPSIL